MRVKGSISPFSVVKFFAQMCTRGLKREIISEERFKNVAKSVPL